MDDGAVREIERFLYREVRLLDERPFHEWLELMTDDIRYWMAARTNRYPRASKAIAILVAGTDCGLGGRVHADPDAGRRASEN